MTDRLLVDLERDGQVSVMKWPENEMPRKVSESKLTWPLDDQALEDLRWYLEDYLRIPFGVYKDRGPAIKARLDEWGKSVFASVFGDQQALEARDEFMLARSHGLELVFRSDDPRLLGLPWELMRDSEGPVALRLAGVSRSLLTTLGPSKAAAVPGGRLRVLMVISRPLGAAGDVGFRMIARPLLERIKAVRGEVELVVLRPPTLDALGQKLMEAVRAGEPFQVVHFDGHGVMPGRAPGPGGWATGMYGAHSGEGDLVFQDASGAADYVPAGRVAEVLRNGKVPLVVLNACQSGAMGKEVEAAVATKMLREGAASVVAMAYSVYAVAAAEFMTAFYEALFAGDSVSEAVTAGRRRLYEHDQRPSSKVALQLADWMVPVHYSRGEVRFPELATPRPSQLPTLEQALNELRAMPVRQVIEDEANAEGFVGRDGLFLELETALRLQRGVVLHGPGGTGKTELARAFAQWWQVTGGTGKPDWVFWHSFESGSAASKLISIVNEIGTHLFGKQFVLQDDDRRTELVVGALRKQSMLLVWDNFESVFTMPAPGSDKNFNKSESVTLRNFLHKVTAPGGSSVVLITSRTEEDWLGRVRRVPVGGLDSDESTSYANILLSSFPAAQERRSGRAFGELMEWLGGHPLSMRIILPLLNTIEPAELLAGLQGTVPLPVADTGDKLTSLPASVTYSFRHLSLTAQRLLPAAGLCADVADAALLGEFSQVPGAPERFAGATEDDWQSVLAEAARLGLLTRLDASTFRMHPALPAYLAARWKADNADDYQSERDASILALVKAAAARADWAREQIETGVPKLGDRLHGTFTTMLGHALQGCDWDAARRLTMALEPWWMFKGETAEADAWADRTLMALEDPPGVSPSLDSEGGELWVYTSGRQANRQLDRARVDEAETINLRILETIEAEPPFPRRLYMLASTYLQLGNIAQERRDLQKAEEWYRRSLAIGEGIKDITTMVKCYNQLGNNALMNDRFDEASEWYGQALPIAKKLRNHIFIAATYHQLGMTDIKRGQLEKAEEWFHQELPIIKTLDDQPHLASLYHQLGMVQQKRERPEEAKEWHFKALAIREDLRYRPDIAESYHQLGVTEHERNPDEAEAWYRKSLAISEEARDRARLAPTYANMARLADDQGRDCDALTWAVRSISLFDQIPHPATEDAPNRLLTLAARLGIDTVEDTWQEVTGTALRKDVRDYITHSADSPTS